MPEGWSIAPIGSVAQEVRDRFDPAAEPNLPYVGLADVEPEQRRIPAFGILEDVTSLKTRFQARDVLFGKLRPYLHKVAQADRDGGASTDILVVRSRNGVDPDFLYWRLTSRSVVNYAERHSAGTKMPRTSWGRLAELEVPLPPLPEQRAIAAILSGVDDAISATRNVIEQTKRVKKGLLQALMTRGIGHTRFKDTELGTIPEDWELSSVGCLITRGEAELQTGPFGTVLKASEYSDQGVPLISVGEIKTGRIELRSDTPRIGSDVVARLPEYLLSEGDIVFARKGGVDRSALITAKEEGWFLGSDGIRLRLTANVLPAFVALHLQRIPIRRWLESNSSGTTMPTLSQRVLNRLCVPIPGPEEQAIIVEVLRAVDGTVRRGRNVMDSLQSLKAGLLQDLLTGRVRVQPD